MIDKSATINRTIREIEETGYMVFDNTDQLDHWRAMACGILDELIQSVEQAERERIFDNLFRDASYCMACGNSSCTHQNRKLNENISRDIVWSAIDLDPLPKERAKT